MAKAIKEESPERKEEADFAVTVGEFLSGITGEVESKRAFSLQVKAESGKKVKTEWQKLYELFKTKPCSIDWQTWLDMSAKKKGGR